MKYLIFAFVSALFTLVTAKPVFACDRIGCFLGGKDQNIVALVEIESIEDNAATVRPYYVFPLNVAKITPSLRINNFQKDSWMSEASAIGDHYLVSLLCQQTTCSLAWGAWAVTGDDLASTRLKTINSGDDAIIQTYISSGGTLTDYYGDDGKTYLRTPSAGDMEIYPAAYPLPQSPAQTPIHYTKPPNIWIFFAATLAVLGVGSTVLKKNDENKKRKEAS